MSEKLYIEYPVIVEGKYDKNTLSQILDAKIIPVGGFSVFNSQEKQKLIRRLADFGAVILLTDSDGGGMQIRKFLLGILPKDKVYNLYIPQIAGKEKRKTKAGKAGLLGVEGMSRELIEKLFKPFAVDTVSKKRENSSDEMITLVDFFELGLTGAADAAERRDKLSVYFDLPQGMSTKALISALNIIADRAQLVRAAEELFSHEV